jgi:hypothetical protein|tara:strand:+ start:2089 stop:2712 length:624 start_codon:yes stop_codon:yes gene_type:complete
MSSISDQFKGLPIGELIANPLIAAAQAQGKLAGITEQFIKEVGLQDNNGELSARTVDFDYDAIVETKSTDAQGVETTTTTAEPRTMKVPLLAIVNTPNLSVKDVTIDFDMKVQTTTMHKDSTDVNVSTSASYKSWWSPVKASMTASVGSKSENTRKTDNSARYTVHCQARDDGAPEGLMKVLDILGDNIKPTPKGGATPAPTPPPGN